MHIGYNIKRIREILGIKQSVLAMKLNCNQQKVSLLEKKAYIEDNILSLIASEFNLPIKFIKEFNEAFVIQCFLEAANIHIHKLENMDNNLVDLFKQVIQTNESLLKLSLNNQELLKNHLSKIS